MVCVYYWPFTCHTVHDTTSMCKISIYPSTSGRASISSPIHLYVLVRCILEKIMRKHELLFMKFWGKPNFKVLCPKCFYLLYAQLVLTIKQILHHMWANKLYNCVKKFYCKTGKKHSENCPHFLLNIYRCFQYSVLRFINCGLYLHVKKI